jgi:hypothetical protein
VNISTPHFDAAIRRFIEDGEGIRVRHQGSKTGTLEKAPQGSVTYRFLNRLLLTSERMNLRSNRGCRVILPGPV